MALLSFLCLLPLLKQKVWKENIEQQLPSCGALASTGNLRVFFHLLSAEILPICKAY